MSRRFTGSDFSSHSSCTWKAQAEALHSQADAFQNLLQNQKPQPPKDRQRSNPFLGHGLGPASLRKHYFSMQESITTLQLLNPKTLKFRRELLASTACVFSVVSSWDSTRCAARNCCRKGHEKMAAPGWGNGRILCRVVQKV